MAYYVYAHNTRTSSTWTTLVLTSTFPTKASSRKFIIDMVICFASTVPEAWDAFAVIPVDEKAALDVQLTTDSALVTL